jgi:hypothetical protein
LSRLRAPAWQSRIDNPKTDPASRDSVKHEKGRVWIIIRANTVVGPYSIFEAA